MKICRHESYALFGLAAACIALSGVAHAENIRTVRQPLVNGAVVSTSTLEDFGLLDFSTGGGGTCSASLLRNEWVITAAHCVEVGGPGATTADPARPGQNLIRPLAGMTVNANWKAVQSRTVVRVETFRPYDIALLRVAAPFEVHGSTTAYSRLIFQDGQFPYFGEPVGANLLVFGQGINVFAQGVGDAATPSQNDGQYRMTYAKPVRAEDRLYWYPSVNGAMIAGGDSGGPSFAWVLSGYALVGVHAVARTRRVPGKPTTGWMWVTATPEAADAPIAPVASALHEIMGPRPPSSDPTDPSLPPPGFVGTFATTPHNYQPLWLYAMQTNGDLLWYRKDSASSAWQGPRKVGTGWAGFKDVIAAGGNRFYALTQDGKLIWYQHDGFNDGSFTWQPPSEVGSGWTFSRIFAGGDGVVYAIRQDGKLLWYRHTGLHNGARSWLQEKEVGSGWNSMVNVFSTGKGAIYAVKPDGTLLLYQHKGFGNGAFAWEPARTVGSGWTGVQQIVSATDGVILTVRYDGKLMRYQHLGFIRPNRLAKFRETWTGPVEIGSGWQGFAKVISLMPESAGPPVR